tara:strand:- start:671 stop:898 length:228 start_codon:yes stop_codon:yes gene_type:complete
MEFPYLMFVGPLIAGLLTLVLILMVRDPKVSEDKMLLLHTLFLEATGSPPTDEEYVIFSQLSRKEMRKVFKKLKK